MNADVQKIDNISREIFSQVRTTIVLNMRFLDMAVFRLRPIPDKMTLATDGEHLFYNPIWLLTRYRDESSAVTRDYLHVLLHCIFRHPFVHTLLDQPLWNLACDITAEGLICEWSQPHFTAKSEMRRRLIVDSLRNKVKPLTAEKLYHYFQDHPPQSEWADLFQADEHDIWYQRGSRPSPNRQKKQPSAGQPDNKPSDPGENPSESSGKGKKSSDQNGQPPESPWEGDGDSAPNPSAENWKSGGASQRHLEDEWRDISEHVQMDMETFAKEQGTRAGSMRQMLAELNRERYNYEAFLKKFAVPGEVMKINDDEFDYIFYTYGLKLYKSMPLIEPLEYKEVNRIREFVIAIDTSGSTSGELVRKFLTKTYNILMSTESFFSKVNLHIIQCDAEIQEAVKITKRDEFDDYLANMTIRGLGGTDFRPVFSLVDQMIRQREFKHLKGLIYFTDGCGTFPERKPEYTAAFVFIQNEYNNLNVPPWAIKLILEKEDL